MSPVTPGAACPRCRTGEVLAVVRVPHGWTNASGRPVMGVGEVLLCGRCDAGRPVTGPLVAYLTAHESVGPAELDDLAPLLRRWMDGVRAPAPDERALQAETEAWRRGDL
ncbi:hypothetical protein E1295_04435 [Nonomuraea mesophila]|uniref:Uncharacterized protein n=1 Tax=Nonomuraea mesophila TaxID=2530382 RepID=A0A4R5FWZ9_9ACTN|nr:DUF6300 family protein [Nonomuraea mesophila]TDE58855.1 hypothetical protein E1295_04435 [Nonomuraea mesophila]